MKFALIATTAAILSLIATYGATQTNLSAPTTFGASSSLMPIPLCDPSVPKCNPNGTYRGR